MYIMPFTDFIDVHSVYWSFPTPKIFLPDSIPVKPPFPKQPPPPFSCLFVVWLLVTAYFDKSCLCNCRLGVTYAGRALQH